MGQERELEDLRQALKAMSLPQERLDISKPENVRWLLRNMQIQNRNHPFFEGALQMLKKLDPA